MPELKSYIVIHGHGGTLSEALQLPQRLLDFECYWCDGIFYIPKLTAIPLRRLLTDGEDDNILFTALRKIAVSRMLLSSLMPSDMPDNIDKMATFRESSIIDNFPSFSIPIGYESRKAAVARLKSEGEREFINLFSDKVQTKNTIDAIIQKLQASAQNDAGVILNEDETESNLEKLLKRNTKRDKQINSEKLHPLNGIKMLRNMEEVGGDLDTVSSALFYAHFLISKAEKERENLKYGKDYQFVFINYHEGLHSLGELPPGNIYMADMPISTIPDLEKDLQFLKTKKIHLVRYEDHHPYTTKHIKMLDKLKKDGLLDYFAMSGPIMDVNSMTEENTLDLKCGADMVYEALIQNKKWDNPAMQHLREITHGEDFASDRHPTGKILTELIKGGICKIELTQTLLKCRNRADILHCLNEKGWYEAILKQRNETLKIADRFMENVQLLEIERPDISDDNFSGPPIDDGSDMPVLPQKRNDDQNRLRILITLAPKTKKDEPKLNIGRACEYFSNRIDNIDYLFFCYGSSLIVGRRLNQADCSLNLSNLFQKIGTDKDGGHAGASVCSPENNQNYPRKILGRVSAANFATFTRYIAKKVSEELNVKVHNRSDISIKNRTSTLSSGGKKVIYLILAAILIGLIVILFR